MENNLIEEAFLCAPMGKAWFKRKGEFYILFLDEDDQEEVHSARTGDIGLLWDACLEISNVTKEIKQYKQYSEQLEKLKQLLIEQRHSYDALAFTLDGLNRKLTDKTRAFGIKLAEKLCRQEEVYRFVRQRLLSRPLAKGMGIEEAIELSKDNDHPCRMLQLYQNVQALDKAWNAVMPKLEPDQQKREKWLEILAEWRILADWVIAVLDHDNDSLTKVKNFCNQNQELASSQFKTLEWLEKLTQSLNQELDKTSPEEQKVVLEHDDDFLTNQNLEQHLNLNHKIFIDAAVEEKEEVDRLIKPLNKKGTELVLPVNTSFSIRQFFNELEQNLLNCNVVVIPFTKVPDRWLSEHLRYCAKIQTKRENPLSVVIYNPTHRKKIATLIPNLAITICTTLEEMCTILEKMCTTLKVVSYQA